MNNGIKFFLTIHSIQNIAGKNEVTGNDDLVLELTCLRMIYQN